MSQHDHEQQNHGDAGQGAPNDPNGNAYASQHQQQHAALNLDARAPQLRSNDARRTNRSALLVLGVLALLLVITFVWMLLPGNGHKDAQRKPQKDETVSVPDAPKAPPLPSTAAPASHAPPQPIAVTPMRSRPQPTRPAPVAPHKPSLVERRIAAAEDAPSSNGLANNPPYASAPAGYANANGPGAWPPGLAGALPGASDGLGQFRMPGNAAYNAKPLADVSDARPLTHPDSLMMRGTYIRCVLETHIVTSIPGFASCIVTEPVYSFNGRHLLLPKGSKVLGSYSQEPNGPRVAVVWDRIVTPTGIDVSMSSPGVDNLGGAGHPGHYDAHWASRISSALLISLLSDAFKYEAAEHGPSVNSLAANGTVLQEPFQSNTAQTMQDLANQAVRQAANRPATVTINQGTVVAIYVAKDVDFTAVLARY
jgi:type IV secretion system protein VirB10